MPRPPLPLECVLVILSFLSEEYDTDTMTRLLCVNRTNCAAALSFLYGDCFNINMHKNRPLSKKNVATSINRLIQTLLGQIHPQDQIPNLFLQVAFLTQDDQEKLQRTAEPPIPVVKY